MSTIKLEISIDEMLALKFALIQERSWLCEALAAVGEGHRSHVGFAEELRCVERLQKKLEQAFDER